MKPKAPGKRSKHTEAQILLKTHLRELGLDVRTEFRFYSERRWRFDLYLPDHRIGIEVDGGMWSGGHKRGAALEDDYEKQNMAQMLGYRILRFSNRQVMDGGVKACFEEWLSNER